MSTTSIALQAPLGETLCLYNRSLPAAQQLPSIPSTFCDSMTVREIVFVREMQAIPLVHHMDAGDARSWHWTLYISSGSTLTGESKIRPIGTIRLNPFPHYPHPKLGANFEAPPPDTPMVDAETFFSTPPPNYAIDRVTSLHDGVEPFLTLGRLCVVKEFRGKKLADQLLQAALRWASENSKCFQKEVIPQWKGLVCLHAHEKAVSMYQRNGFVLDEKMGMFYEAGIRHYGMFTRVKVKGHGEVNN